jgi:Cu/Ag efflux pump CusA
MGTAVIGGMLTASFLAIFIIPALFYMIERLGGAGQKQVKAPLPTPAPEAGD